MGAARKTQPEMPPTPTREELDSLVAAANNGTPGGIEKLREVLDACPQIWQHVGSMGRQAETAIVALIARGDKLVHESLLREINRLRSELCGSKCSALEELLIQRFLVTWLHSQHLSASYQVQPEQSMAHGKYLMSLRESAQRQCNAALNALMTYRKLAPPRFGIQRATVPFPGGNDVAEDGQ